MLRRLGLCLCLLNLASSQVAIASPMADDAATGASRDGDNLPVEGVVTNPEWLRKPDGDDMAHFYPPLAQMFSLSGRAVIDCTVTVQGSLSDCTVGGEKPVGVGFGQAALGLSGLFRMKPQTLDGAPVGGARIRVPIHFVAPPVPASSAPPPPEAKPAALALGDRLAMAMTSNYADRVKAGVDNYRKAYAPQGVTQEQTLAFDDLEQAYVANIPNVRQRYARAYANAFSEDELKAILAFVDSPAGKAWIGRSAQIETAQHADDQADAQALVLKAKALLCGQIACEPDGAPPATAPAK